MPLEQLLEFSIRLYPMQIDMTCVYFFSLFAPKFVFIKFSQAESLPFAVFFSLNL